MAFIVFVVWQRAEIITTYTLKIYFTCWAVTYILKQTGQNLCQIFNTECLNYHMPCSTWVTTKQLSFKLITRTNKLLGYILSAFALPVPMLHLIHSQAQIYFKAGQASLPKWSEHYQIFFCFVRFGWILGVEFIKNWLYFRNKFWGLCCKAFYRGVLMWRVCPCQPLTP